MATAAIIGLGSVWGGQPLIQPPGWDHQIGLFKWILRIQQSAGSIGSPLLNAVVTKGGNDGEGGSNFIANTQCASQNWDCDGQTGKILSIVSISSSQELTQSWSIGLTVSKTPSITINWSGGGGAPAKIMQWVFLCTVCPDQSGCPIISKLDHTATVANLDYYWGNVLTPVDNISDVNQHAPEVFFTDHTTSPACNSINIPTTEGALPLRSPIPGTTTDDADIQ